MPSRIPDDEREAIAEAIRSGQPRNEIAREFKRSPGTISNIATEFGLTSAFDRTATENATRARTADMKAQRAELAQILLDDALKLRERAWTQYTYYERSKDGVERVQLDLPPLAEVRNAYTALAIAIDKHVVLDRHDSDATGLAAVDAWLRDMIGD